MGFIVSLGLIEGVFETALHISEIESVFPNTEDGPGPACLKRVASDDIPIVLDDHIDGEWDGGILFCEGDADLSKAIILIGWWGGLDDLVIDLDGGGDVLGSSVDGDGVGIEPGQSKAGVEDSSDGGGAEGRVQHQELVTGNSVPSLIYLGQLHLHDWIAELEGFELHLTQNVVGVGCPWEDISGRPAEDAGEGEAEKGED